MSYSLLWYLTKCIDHDIVGVVIGFKYAMTRDLMANKEQKKEQKAAPKSNKQKKEAAKEKKAAKLNGGITLNKE